MISGIVPETCRAIVAAYGDEVMQVANTPEQWKEVARGFEQRWNFPHTFGAIDGKHIHIQNQLGKMLDQHEDSLPAPERLLNKTEDKPPVDYFFIGDDTSALKKYMMKPCPARSLTKPERIYNYRLSRARRTVENTFRILASRFRVFHAPIQLRHDRIKSVVLAAYVLHNLIFTRNPHARSEGDQEDLGDR
ncbi:uncharacterized protein [Macrobrachium rosenbergii]|uniref:uncharacterized protein n=1 Tax=Macrobrachium rosenbergii TaxID=79674 RepID=UPI0034D62856